MGPSIAPLRSCIKICKEKDALSTMQKEKKTFFMQEALKQAKKALALEEVPIGAVIVGPDNKIIARAYNKIETMQSQTAHAEILAIQKAYKKVNNWRLNGCWIYVTLEPCLMCLGLIKLSRLQGIVFGGKSTLFGIGINEIADQAPFYMQDLKIEGGVENEESLSLLKSFFKKVRKKEKGQP